MKTFSTLLLVFVSTFIMAQSTDSSMSAVSDLKFEKGDLGVTANLTGLILNTQATPRTDFRGTSLLMLRYSINPKLVLRVGLAPVISSYRVTSADSVGKDLVEFDSTASQSMFSFQTGLEYHFAGTRRLDPYVALDGEAGIVSRFNAGSNTNITDTTGTANFTRTITEDGGFSLGAKASLGMNYFVVPKLSLGMEYGMGVWFLATGGDRQEVLQSDPVTGAPTTSREESSNRTFTTNFYVDPFVSLTLSYFFSL